MVSYCANEEILELLVRWESGYTLLLQTKLIVFLSCFHFFAFSVSSKLYPLPSLLQLIWHCTICVCYSLLCTLAHIFTPRFCVSISFLFFSVYTFAVKIPQLYQYLLVLPYHIIQPFQHLFLHYFIFFKLPCICFWWHIR